MAEEQNPNVLDVSVENEMQSSYIDYAMSVIVGRALPDARDGLKPAQRRILYAMYALRNTHDQPTKKSARIVGEVIGKYHPHGDAAVYETLVRMAQDFSMNCPLVEGQGNMGSIDGDPPAAQRYTEVRLTKVAEEMLSDLEKRAVPFSLNFDNTEEEPVVLPSKVPNLLLNGSSGIAVGVATNILPHNMSEVCNAIVAYIDNMQITPLELLDYVKGPDFPTGGIAFMDERLKTAYMSGRGSVTIRGKAHIEEHLHKRQYVIDEIPYAVNKSTLVEKIASLVKEKLLDGVGAVRDESDKSGMRIVVELRADANADVVLNQLYKHTQMQVSMPVMNIAVLGNRLLTLNIRDFVKIFVEHRIGVIRQRTAYDLNIASERRHIVEGLIIALHDIDGVIKTIKSSSDTKAAKEALMHSYGVSEKQAAAILDMKLSKLTRLEGSALDAEKAELDKSIEYYNDILAHEDVVYKIIKDETTAIKERYGTARKTEIVYEDAADIENEELIKDYQSTVILTAAGYMKRLTDSAYKMQNRGGKGVITMELKEGDYVKQAVHCMSKDYLFAVTNLGRAYWLKAYKIPESNRYGSGKAAPNLIPLGEHERIEKIINTRSFDGLFINFLTSRGMIKRSEGALFSRPRASGIIALKLQEGDSISDVCISDGKSELFITTRQGKAIRFKEDDARPVGRAAMGVRGIKLSQKDAAANIIAVKPSDMVASITSLGYGKITEIGRYRLQNRGGKGVINVRVSEKTGTVVKSLRCSTSDSILLLSSNGLSIRFSVDSIRTTGRGTKGVRLMKLDNAAVVDAQLLSEGAEQ